MAADPIPAVGTAAAQPQPSPGSTQDQATSAFNLSFESLLKIIMTQLSFQDPLKPMDNFEFVSQLAQFSQIQIGQNGNDRLQELAAAQATIQATALLGKTVDVPGGSATLTGKVVSVSFAAGVPKLAIKTAEGSTISNISMSAVTQVREGN
jgi:flagellar basal-body rod modification protein FlgD